MTLGQKIVIGTGITLAVLLWCFPPCQIARKGHARTFNFYTEDDLQVDDIQYRDVELIFRWDPLHRRYGTDGNWLLFPYLGLYVLTVFGCSVLSMRCPEEHVYHFQEKSANARMSMELAIAKNQVEHAAYCRGLADGYDWASRTCPDNMERKRKSWNKLNNPQPREE